MKKIYTILKKNVVLWVIFLANFTFIASTNAQVACSSCTSNDFQFNSFFIGDASGSPLVGTCTVGSTVNARLWMNVTNSSTRYSLKVYYNMIEYNPLTGFTSTSTIENCLYNNVAIPNQLIDLGPISYVCGNQLTIDNFQMHWKQNNTISCSYDAPKCLCIPPTIVAAQLSSSFTYSACNNGSNKVVNFTSSVIGGKSPFTYSWNFGDLTTSSVANPTKTYTGSGPYNVTLSVTDANGTVSTSTQTINLPSQNSAPTVSASQPSCSVATGSITISSPTGTGITYSINGTSYQSSNVFSSVASGSYNVTYKSADGCTSTATAITINPQPIAATTPVTSVTQPTCSVATGTITITSPVGAGFTYSIDGTNYQSSNVFSGINAGTYSVTAKSAGGCLSTSVSTVINSQPATPSIPILSVSQPTCNVATGTITVSSPTGSGVTYSVDGLNYQPSNIFSNLSAGNYNVTSKNTVGCVSASTSVTVNAQPATPSLPVISLTQPTCTSSTGIITVSSPSGVGVTYSINGSSYQTSNTFSGIAAGSYNVTARSAAGCTSTATLAVINTQPSTPSTPNVSISQPTCNVSTGTVTITSPTGAGITYSIDGLNYQVSNIFSGLLSGNYPITAKNSTGCVSNVSNVTINAQPATPSTPTIAYSTSLSFCVGESVDLTSSALTGNQWYLNGTIISGATNQVYTATVSGYYTVIVTNASGCLSPASAPVTVVANSKPVVGAITGSSGSVCEGGTVTLSSSPSGGVWTSNNTSLASINASTGELAGLSAGTVSITYTVTNSFGCTSSNSTNITISPATNASIVPSGAVTGCAGSGLILTASSAASYQWYKDGVIIPSATGQTYSVTTNGSYYVIITSASGCVSMSAATTVTLVTISPTTIAASGNTTLCNGSTVELCPAVWGWSNYQWYLNGTAIAAPQGTMSCMTVGTSGSYTLEIQDGAGCWSTQSSPIVVTTAAAPATPVITAGGPLAFCYGGSVLLTSSSATNNQWYLNGGKIVGATGQTYSATEPGTYTVAVEVGTCSAQSAGVAVTINSALAPIITSPNGTSFCANDGVQLVSSSAVDNQWYLNGVAIVGATNQNYTATVAGIYTVSVSNGTCTVYSSNSVSVVQNSITAPNISSTNGTVICANGTIQLCPSSWGWSNYQWYKNGVAIAAPTGNASCITLDSTGIGSYTLAVTNGAGCVSTQSSPLVVSYNANCNGGSGGSGSSGINCNISASIGVNSLVQCVTGNSYQFTGNVTGGTAPFTYLWDLNDGTIATTKDVTHTYATYGEHDVTFIVKDANGCEAHASTVQIYIGAKPAGAFNIIENTGNGTGISFNSTSTIGNGWMTYQWDLGNGTTSNVSNPGPIYYTAGTYTVTMIVTGNIANAAACSDTVTRTIVVNANGGLCLLPIASFTASADSACLGGNLFVFNNTSSNSTSYSWNFGDGSALSSIATGSHSYIAAGNYTVSLIATNACGSNTATSTVVVTNSPIIPAAITGTTTLTVGNSTLLSSTTAGGVWTSDNSAVATINSSSGVVTAIGVGTATISYSVSNSCGTASREQIITVNAACVATTSTTNVAICSSVLPYVWNGISYNSAGSYTKTFVNGNATGCDSTATLVLTINNAPAQPSAISGSTSILEGSSTTLSSATVGGIWSSGNTAVATINPSTGEVTAVSAGSVTITYTVSNSCGSNSRSILVTVVSACVTPAANFSVNTLTQCISGNSFVFTNSTTGTVSGYTWNFGDGSSTTTASPSHSYTAAGTYTVTLTAASACGSSSKTASVTILPSQVAPLISGSTSVIVGSTTTLSATLAGGVWSSSNTTVATVDATTGLVTGVTAGNAVITYTVTGTCGTASANTTVNVSCNLQASFSINNSTQCVTNNSFVYTSSVTGGVAPYSYLWNFHDGSISTSTNPTKVYATHGEGNVTLQVTDSRGCVANAASIREVVGAQPTANFSVIDNTGTGTSKTFISSSTIAAGSMSYAWDFGNGQTSTLINPTVNFVPGNYTVTLVVTGNAGCTAKATQSITQTITSSVSIYPNPVMGQVEVSFRSASVTPTTVQIMDLSGRLIQAQTMTPAYTGQVVNAAFNMSSLQSGTYVIKIIDQQNGVLATKTMLKQ